MYEGIDKVMNIHTPVLDGDAGVLQLEGWHSVFLWSLGMPQLRYISINIITKKDRVLWVKQTYGTSLYFQCYLQAFCFFFRIELPLSIVDGSKAY
jgi:hypothetical protein